MEKKCDEVFLAMKDFAHHIGLDPDSACMTVDGSRGYLTISEPSASPKVREALVGRLGEPKRGGYRNKDANWAPTEGRAFMVGVYSWPWTSCDSCGQELPAPVPA